MDIPSLLVIFTAGMATILTPCCLPMLPPLLSGSIGHRLRPVAIISGSLVSFTLLGILVGAVGALHPDAIRAPAFIVIIAFGAVMADDDLYNLFGKYASRFAGRGARLTRSVERAGSPIISAFILGLMLGILWLPCVGPVLGAVLAYAGTTGSPLDSGLLLFVYGAGFSVPLLMVAYGGKTAMQSIQGRAETLAGDTIRKIAGYVLLGSGVALLFELDRVLLSAL